MKIGAIFTDYDGTIAPFNVSRERSRVPLKIAAVLRKTASEIPVAIITSKDYSFVRPRTEFACAWACCSGLDVIHKNGHVIGKKQLHELTNFACRAKQVLPETVFVEEKRSINGELLGICIDWQSTSNSSELKNELMEIARSEDVYIDYWSTKFIDFYSTKPNKGLALTQLKNLLGINDAVLYIGDSAPDNPAFQNSDISLGVDHGQTVELLKCKYLLPFKSVGALLGLLLETDLDFSPKIIRYAGGKRWAC